MARLTDATLSTWLACAASQYGYEDNTGHQRTRQNFNLDSADETARGWEADTTTPRLQEQFGYEYDAAWNLNRRTNNALVQTFGVNNRNELTNATRSGTLTVAGLASQPGANLDHVAARPVRYVANGAARVGARQDLSGRTCHCGKLSHEVNDGMLVVQERHFQPQVSTNIPINTISYTRGSDLGGSLQGAGGIGGLLARTDHSTLNLQPATAHAYYHADGNGNITALVNTNGAIVARYQYDPYGNLLGMAGTLAEANTYFFSSKEWHANAGLYYYGFRYYEPNLQRWLNRDPIHEAGGINLFCFVLNQPVSMVDPFGWFGDIYVDDNCKGMDLSGFAYQAEKEKLTPQDKRDGLKEGRKPLRELPPPGYRVKADALYYPGGAIKIGNLGHAWIDCSSGKPEHKFRRGPRRGPLRSPGDGAIWNVGEPEPPVGNWPDNAPDEGVFPVPPYDDKPPTKPLPPLGPILVEWPPRNHDLP